MPTLCHRVLPGALLAALAVLSAADVYRCGDRFSDRPCGEEAEAVELRPPSQGVRFDRGLEPDSPQEAQEDKQESQPAAREEEEHECPFISSTRLRTLVIREEVAPGMTPEQVLRALGNPDHRYSDPQMLWTYDLHEDPYIFPNLTGIRRVYFRNGCVSEVRVIPQ